MTRRAAVIDGRKVRATSPIAIRARVGSLLTPRAARTEARVEASLRAKARLSRPNVVAVLSTRGGVGKTTCAFAIGGMLAGSAGLRTLAIDADPCFGTLGSLLPDRLRANGSLSEACDALETITSAPELRRYVSRASSGLDVMAGHRPPLPPERLGQLLAFVSRFYDVVILDAGPGLAGGLAELALERADQTVFVATPDRPSARSTAAALRTVRARRPNRRGLIVLNKVGEQTGTHWAIEPPHEARDAWTRLGVPFDSQLRLMLETGTYGLGALDPTTRIALKRIAAEVARGLV
jgi:MinD-like ATPase involved in chromosome partitioning or flagellar assembly